MAKLPPVGAELLRQFGYPTRQEEYYEIPLVTQRRAIEGTTMFTPLGGIESMSFFLDLNGEDFRAAYLNMMESYPEYFTGKRKVSCYGCKKPIILPIDLRRDRGFDFHGHCQGVAVKKELQEHGEALTHDTEGLEYRLRVARLCRPRTTMLDEQDTILTLGLLEFYDIATRAQLEAYYWHGKTPRDET
ncbi:MAG TPA: hypothetical protein VJB87_01700 [Candidatus Nanoarchaeia archaeon]|nr:hypothetical protein [Candidatus Nanoarchaeia archaeon]